MKTELCVNCGTPFEKKRCTQRFCKPVCASRYYSRIYARNHRKEQYEAVLRYRKRHTERVRERDRVAKRKDYAKNPAKYIKRAKLGRKKYAAYYKKYSHDYYLLTKSLGLARKKPVPFELNEGEHLLRRKSLDKCVVYVISCDKGYYWKAFKDKKLVALSDILPTEKALNKDLRVALS